MLLIAMFLLFFFSFLLVGLFRVYALKTRLLDKPNQRSSHTIPTPRGGGVVFPILWLIYLLILYFFHKIPLLYLWVFVPASFLISAIGFLDDRFHLEARWRFLIQVVAALLSLIALGGFSSIQIGTMLLHLGWFGCLVAVLALIWSTNLYNFMDGIDGIASIEALFVFGVGGYFVWHAGGYGLANIIWVLAVIVLGFFLWNRPPAKIFMGDVGSALLGFLVMLFALAGEIWYKVPILLWIILYGVFWFDATVTLIRRVKHGEVWYQAHRQHAYQRLQLKKWSHAKILAMVIFINGILSVLAFLAYLFPALILISLLLVFVILCLVYWKAEKLQPMY